MLGLPETACYNVLTKRKPTELKIQLSLVISIIFTTAFLLLEGAKMGQINDYRG